MNANLDRSSNVNHLHDAKANSSILPSVTVIGLGSMGSKLARTFLHSGYVTTVWNRTPEKAAELVGLVPRRYGNRRCHRRQPLLIICVLDYDAARHILEPIKEKLPARLS